MMPSAGRWRAGNLHRRNIFMQSALFAGVALLHSSAVVAHSGTGLAGGVVSGLVHPLQGFDHLLAMVLVGVWGADLGRPLIFVLPMLFPLVMVAGAIMGMASVPLPSIEIGIALSVIILGTCVALSVKAPVGSASIVVAMFAICHGYAHGRELPSAADAVGYSSGFVLATGLLHVAGIGIGFLARWPAGALLARSAGAGAAVAGLGLLVGVIRA
jgi:urease accessory protein